LVIFGVTTYLHIGEKPVPENSHKSKSILCVGMEWFPSTAGGLNRYVYELTHHLAASQDRVELCALGVPEVSENYLLKLTNLSDPNLPLWQRLWYTRTNFLSREAVHPDAINLHFALYSLPILPALPEKVPITFTFHGPWAFESEQEGASKLSAIAKLWLEKIVYQRCDRFIVLSQAFGTILHQHYQVPWSKIHVIPGGVDTDRFNSNLSRFQAREQLHWPQDRIILFAPRRLVHRVGIDKLLTALAKIKSRFPQVWLAVAGRGPLQEKLEEQARELELNESVKFLGYLPDEQLPIAYQAADLTVVPSQSLEGFGLILLESLACGTPVFCTPVGGMPEILAPFSPQLITDSTDGEAIATRLESWLSGEISLPSRSECREYAFTHFNWPKIAQQVRQVLLA
jgi:glycosyltransferase involved in cell wall biosynthesis